MESVLDEEADKQMEELGMGEIVDMDMVVGTVVETTEYPKVSLRFVGKDAV